MSSLSGAYTNAGLATARQPHGASTTAPLTADTPDVGSHVGHLMLLGRRFDPLLTIGSGALVGAGALAGVAALAARAAHVTVPQALPVAGALLGVFGVAGLALAAAVSTPMSTPASAPGGGHGGHGAEPTSPYGPEHPSYTVGPDGKVVLSGPGGVAGIDRANPGNIVIVPTSDRAMSFASTDLHLPPGRTTFVLDNADTSHGFHNIVIRGNGIDVGSEEVGFGRTSGVTVDLQPGKTYEFFCVAHLMWGMRGTITVDAP